MNDFSELVDFSSRFINSNSSFGIRISQSSALSLPYLSARTCLAAGISLPMDTAGGAVEAGKVSKMYNALENGTVEEQEEIEGELLRVRKIPFIKGGGKSIDRRIRQLLLPQKSAATGYVSVSPLTAIGLSALLFGPSGLVSKHNDSLNHPDALRIRRAHLAFGGANPHNLGYFSARWMMQYPILLSAPDCEEGMPERRNPSKRGRYLILPNLRVQCANILTNQILVNGPPISAAWGMGHALEREMGRRIEGVCLVMHYVEPLGEREYGAFEPSQRRGAAFTFEKSRNGSDYTKGTINLSLQPGVCAHMRVSVVYELSRDLTSLPRAIEAFLATGRFAGGLITSYGKPDLHDDRDTLLECLPVGRVIVDRRDLMASGNPLENLVNAIGYRHKQEWLSATNIGYSAITDFGLRGGARDGHLHAFAEPLIGIVEYVNTLDRAQSYFWHDRWLDDSFLLEGGQD